MEEEGKERNEKNQSRQYQFEFDSNFRLNADNSSKKTFCLFWIIFALIEIAVFIASNFTPDSLIFKTNHSQLSKTQHSRCTNPVQFVNGALTCQDFKLKSPRIGLILTNLSPMHQFAQINLLYLPKIQTDKPLSVTQTFQVELMSLVRKEISLNENQKAIIFVKGQDVRVIPKITFSSKEHHIQNEQKRGYQVNLGYYRQFATEDALLVITFNDLTQNQLDNYQIFPQALLMNPNYTIFIIVIRAVFLTVIVVTFLIFLIRHKKNPSQMQQKIVLILSGAGVMFNDPYYFIQVFRPNLFCLFVSTIFLAIFLITLFLSWVCMLQKIKDNSEGQSFIITRKMMVLLIGYTICCFSVLFYFLYEISYYSYTQSPIIPTHQAFNTLYVITLVLAGVVFAYIIWLYGCIVKNWDNLLWRDKTYASFNIFFIVLIFSFISLGWLSFYQESSQKIQIFYSSMNLYVLYLQYMYSMPPRKEIQRGSPIKPLEQQTQMEQSQPDFVTVDLEQNQNDLNKFIEAKNQ